MIRGVPAVVIGAGSIVEGQITCHTGSALRAPAIRRANRRTELVSHPISG
ncbi:hypothetical protein NSERUTF1_5875 [Nocardia seriolae]|nr:hypothetical protein NSERUTF1_5875 [Nocardia seriolae]